MARNEGVAAKSTMGLVTVGSQCNHEHRDPT
jgi:hypothetical protein